MQMADALMPLMLLQVCLFQAAWPWYTLSDEGFDQDTDNPGTSAPPSWLATDVNPPAHPLVIVTCHLAGRTCTAKQHGPCMQVQFHAEHSWRGRDEPVPDCSVCTLVHQCLHAGGHCGVSAGQHLPHGGLHGNAAASWGMHHCP